MFYDSCSFDFNYIENQSIINLLEDNNNYNKNYNEEDEEEDIKSQKGLIYDIIQDNLAQMKNSLIILRRRLINQREIPNSKRGPKPKKELDINNNINENNSNEESFLKKRKIIKKKYKHSKYSYDNIFSKIKSLYHKFIVLLANDIYNNCNTKSYTKNFIRKISGKVTQNNTISYNKKMAEMTLKEFLSNSISSVYSKLSENQNEKNIELIYKDKEKYEKLILLLNYKYKDFYQNFYIKDDCDNLIEDNYNLKKRKYISFKESIEQLSKKESKDFMFKFIDFAKYKFIKYLEGNRVNLKIIYDTKIEDLFNND